MNHMDFATYNFESVCCERDMLTTHRNTTQSQSWIDTLASMSMFDENTGYDVRDTPQQVGEKSMINPPSSKNYLDRNRYVTYIKIKDFDQLPRFFINTPHFSFDSHDNTTGWRLDVKQRWYANTPGKLVVRLTHESTANHGGIKIRIDKNSLGKRIETVEDVAELFAGVFDLVHAGTVVQMPKAIGSYTDEELLAEVSRRTRARLGDYRGPKTIRTIDETVDIDNVVEFTKIREVKYDEGKLLNILVA